ncbi:MAG TPA: DUF2155 domain-containing protein, partial [Caulobacter sp.]|nr:DUF2155 domain-containing protein [Caulobacter sp.]
GLTMALAVVAAAQQTSGPPPKAPPAAKTPPAAPAAPAPEEPPPADVAPPPPVTTAPTPVPVEPIPEEKPAAKPRAAQSRPVEPVKRVRSGSAIIQALDKVTAETLRFEVPINGSVRYKSLVFTVRACETAAPDEEAPESAAYIQVDSSPKPQPGRPAPPTRQVFRGWMFASSPGLNPLQHPVYDAWLIACKAG